MTPSPPSTRGRLCPGVCLAWTPSPPCGAVALPTCPPPPPPPGQQQYPGGGGEGADHDVLSTPACLSNWRRWGRAATATAAHQRDAAGVIAAGRPAGQVQQRGSGQPRPLQSIAVGSRVAQQCGHGRRWGRRRSCWLPPSAPAAPPVGTRQFFCGAPAAPTQASGQQSDQSPDLRAKIAPLLPLRAAPPPFHPFAAEDRLTVAPLHDQRRRRL